MHHRTLGILGQLEEASWFSRVGLKVGPAIIVVTGWPQAIEQCSSFEWEDLRLASLNQYRKTLAHRSEERLGLWSSTLADVKKITGPLVDRKIAGVVREHDLPEIFKIRVRNDITGACMESEYADVCPPGLFTSIGQWYVDGHFPCGWWGAFPLGKLVVY